MRSTIKEEKSIQEQIALIEDFNLEEEAEVLVYAEDVVGELFLKVMLKNIRYLTGDICK